MLVVVQAYRALEMYKRAANQAERLALLYQQYAEIGIGSGVQYPTVAVLGENYLRSLETYLAEEGVGKPSATQQVSAQVKAVADRQFDETWRRCLEWLLWPCQHPLLHSRVLHVTVEVVG